MAENYIKPVVTGIPTIEKNRNNQKVDKNTGDFNNIFQNEISKIKFSKHAMSRIADRNIDMTDSMKDKVSEAIDLASQKGIRESLILFNDMAFVVNIDSRTVVTAIDKENMENKVFTNIDGAVCL